MEISVVCSKCGNNTNYVIDEKPLSSHVVLGDVGELLPCPFCGSKVELTSLGGDEENWAIICNECKCACSEMGVSGEEKDDIIKAWNRRANYA